MPRTFGGLGLWAAVVVAAVSTASFGQETPSPSPPAKSAEAAAADAAFTSQDWPAAAKAYEAIAKANADAGPAWFRWAFSLQAQGQHDAAIEVYRQTTRFPNLKGICQYNIACSLSLKGDKEGAFRELFLGIDAGFRQVEQLKGDADLASLRDDPRFKLAVRRMTPIQELAKEFAFWVGEWNVLDPSGAQVGTSRIESAERGCLIIENWSNMQAGTGRSINFVDPVDRRWRQIWVDPTGTVVRYEGGLKDGTMVFEGTATPAFGPAQLSRMSFVPSPDGKVTQKIERSNDNGQTWQPYFTGVYVRKVDQPAKASEPAKP